jgi:hypothetical protein
MRSRFLVKLLVTAAAVCLLLTAAYGQNLDKRPLVPNLEPRHSQDQLLPVISFELVLEGETSPSYAISVDSSGNAAFRARELLSERQVGAGQSDIMKFTIGQPTCTRIFELAQQANYFEHGSAPAMAALDPTFGNTTGVFTTVSYSYGPLYPFDKGLRSIRSSITYSGTNDPALQQLTAIFESIYHVLQQGTPAQPVNVAP